ncbi:MAG: YihY/virulence factor BrkB family protein [Firmicutes bacterium]|nr:YihY/virulence factor BrkB family protein [Bacillota bacterium]MBQ9972492.1 YihY/virulence factor BrkB family protein [Bacillota bacterium]
MLSKERIRAITFSILKQFKDPFYNGFAATLGFYFMLSVVPMMILLSQLLGLFSLSMQFLEMWITQYITGEAIDIITSLVHFVPSTGTNILFTVMALWAASRAQFAMMRLTNYTYSEGRRMGKGFWRDRMRAVVTIAFTLFALTFALVIIVYGEMILKIVISWFAFNREIAYELNRMWFIVRWPLTVFLYLFMVSYNYYILPMDRKKFRDILPGAVFASVGMFLATTIFRLYANNTANYDIIYGALATVVVIMIWFYILAWFLGVGVMFNKAWDDTRHMANKRR